ncbi:hypothetical protein J5N97_009390 [Dioscorea zingiberensis]|uniref:Bifunctional inhibitor/plant lipid transfer protein/seed storage helical domain-containing protein n=1 Tax=Dioscorea zingiberensis TaxID=325984 RepID=A0A9D5HLF2_9LILI|nr:hypothetical protein J5N97_009390 [Dioscorea zingiberensis]
MERMMSRFLVVVLVVFSFSHGDHKSSMISVVMADEGICNMSMAGLDSCKPAASGSPPQEPSQECCQALAGADLQCLCSYKNSVWLRRYGIDPDLAMQLPEKCNLQLPQDEDNMANVARATTEAETEREATGL